MVKFLVLALFYGDHPELALRCGASLRALWNTGRVDLRIGLNEASPRTRAVLDELLPGIHRESAEPQIYKHPMMRRLVAGYRGDATHMMWFDDDSCLKRDVDVPGWLHAVGQRTAAGSGCLGALFTTQLDAVQKEWVRRQSWYLGRDVPDVLPFPVGGWTVLPLEFMRRTGYPDANVHQAAGDVVLGALLHQHGIAPEHFRVGLAINADAQLRDAASPRRGVTEPAHVQEYRVWGPGR
ncbi:MAG TPA: hypothetical protein VIL30_09030 [Ramlibacter sp.]|jgi:hypothetical protein